MSGFLILGPLSKDTIIQKGKRTYSLGGAVYYQSLIFSALDIDHTAVVTLANQDRELLNQFPEKTIIRPVFKKESIIFENKYLNNDPNHRIQRSNAPKIPLTRKDLLKLFDTKLEFDNIVLAPLLPWDLPLDTVKYLYKQKIPLYAGVQGYLRDLNQGNIMLKPSPDFEQVLSMLDIVFLDENEFKSLKINKNESYREIAARIFSYGLQEIVVTCGDRGSLIYLPDKNYKIQAHPPSKVIDPTGLGDTYLAAYLTCKNQNPDSLKCAKMASHLATLKLENKKPSSSLLNKYR